MATGGLIDVAKKKANAAKAGPASGPKGLESYDRKPIVVQLRGSLEFKAVLEKIAAIDGTSVAAFVDRSIRRYAKEVAPAEVLPKR